MTCTRTLAAVALVGLAVASPSARAHYPHDQAYFAAVSPDPARWRVATTLERIELTILGVSDDGLSWDARLVQAQEDGNVTSGVFLTADRLVLAVGGRGLLVSEDAGDRLAPAAGVTDTEVARVVASPAVLLDGTAFAAGDGAIWRTRDAGLAWEDVLDGDGFVDLDVSPAFAEDGRVCALDADAVWCSADAGETWTARPLPASSERISVGEDGRLWLSAREEGLFASDDGGETWSERGFADDDVVMAVEVAGDVVFVATSARIGWRSEDGGETFTAIDVQNILIDQSYDGVTAFDVVDGPDGTLYLAAWEGLARSDDRGRTWTFYCTERAQNTHAIQLTRGDDGAIHAWMGTYGSGPPLVDVAKLRATSFPAMPERFTRGTAVTADWADDGVAVFDAGYSTWRTTDAGESWVEIAADEVEDGAWQMGGDVKGVALSPDPIADPFVLAVVGETVVGYRYSEDLGTTWEKGFEEPRCGAQGFSVALSPGWPDTSRAWGACGGAIYESVDRARTFSLLGDTGASFVFRIVEEPDGAVLVATSDGLWRMSGPGVARVAFEGHLVSSVATSAVGDTRFALVPDLGWHRSDDGGDTWTALDAPTKDVPRAVALSPDFEDDGIVAVAGYGGAWASADRGDTWASIYALEVYESSHDGWRKTGEWRDADHDGASSGDISETVEPGATATFDFEGIGAALEVPTDVEAGVFRVSVDDGPSVDVQVPGDDVVVWESTDLLDRWHTLRIDAGGGVVTLDALRITRIAPIGGEDAEDSGDSGVGPSGEADTTARFRACGCNGGGSAAVWVGLLAWRAGRGRSRARRRT
ncbi:MAG: hypothetical protein ACOZNI_29530 [Myxococcota bacterium]